MNDVSPGKAPGHRGTMVEVSASQHEGSGDASLTRSTIGFLRRLAWEVEVLPGEVILRRGQPGKAFYVVLEGVVEVSLEGADGRKLSLARLEEGATFGELSVLRGAPVSADVIAVTRAKLLAYPPDQLEAALAERPSLRNKLMQRMAGSLSRSVETTWDFYQRSEVLSALVAGGPEGPALMSSLAGMKVLLRRLDTIALTDDPVLLIGEEGTGKQEACRRIHRTSARGDGPLIVLDCGRLDDGKSLDLLVGTVPCTTDGDALPRGLGALHLAHGGTLVLRNLEVLSPGDQAALAEKLHSFQGQQTPAYPDLRLIGTVLPPERHDRPMVIALEQCFPALVELPPLRKRRRDIPVLARRFLREAKTSEERLSLSAEHILMSLPYRHRNVSELKDVVDLAVRCSGEGMIRAEHVFSNAGGSVVPGLEMKAPLPLKKWVLSGRIAQLRAVVAAGFLGVVFLALFEFRGQSGRVANAAVWSLWEPAVFGLFLLVGRVWCTVCPLATVGQLARRLRCFGYNRPQWLRGAGPWLASAGFMTILWVEAVFQMPANPRNSAFLLIGLFGAAALAAVVFERDVWCRDLCPLGYLGATLAPAAPLFISARPEVCSAGCLTHECFKGCGDVPGCQVFHHPQQAADAHNCRLCMDCLRTCPNEAPALRLRPPLVGIRHAGDSSVNLVPFALALLPLTLLFAALARGSLRLSPEALAGVGCLSIGSAVVSWSLLKGMIRGAVPLRRVVAARLALSLAVPAWGALMCTGSPGT